MLHTRQSPTMLTNREGKPWSESGFQGAWGKATMRAGIRGLTFHDLRGTAVVTLARAGSHVARLVAGDRVNLDLVASLLTGKITGNLINSTPLP